MRLETVTCKVALRFPGTVAGGWDPSEFMPLATQRHRGGRGRAQHGARRSLSRRKPLRHGWGRDTGEEEKGRDEADRGPHMAVREEEMWVVDRPAVRWVERPGGLAV
jgi:RNA-splicing ligase RtcB